MRTSLKSFLLIVALFSFFSSYAANYTWTGSTNTNWSTATNWSPNGVPGVNDTAKVVSVANAPVLQGNITVKRFTMQTGTLNLNSNTLTVSNEGYFIAGTISSGTLILRGLIASFTGTNFSGPINAINERIVFSGGTFADTCYFEINGLTRSDGFGGCVFNAAVTIKKTGNVYFNMGMNTADTFNAPVKFINTATYAMQIGYNSVCNFNDSLSVESTNAGGISFSAGSNSGGAILASGKKIGIGAGGFTNGILTLKNFVQQGNSTQNLTATGSAIFSLVNATFNGKLTINSPGILLKSSVFNDSTEFIRSANSSSYCDGGNTFNGAVTFRNNATNSASFRLAVQAADVFNSNVTFITNTGYIQPAYSGINEFKGNVNINSVYVVFNYGPGKVLCAGTTNQTFSATGSISFVVSKFGINKSSGGVTFSSPITVDSLLELTSGNISTSSTSLLSLKAAVTVAGGSDISFVNGPLKKIGNTTFIFPTGKQSYYRPIEMTAPSIITDAFTGEYFSSGQPFGSTMDVTVKFIDNCNYWNLSRNTGSSNVNVRLYWDNNGCGLLDSAASHIVNWNGSTWKDLGNGGILGNRYNGKLANATSVVTYGNFTLAYNSCYITAYTNSIGDTTKVQSLNGSGFNTYLWSNGATTSFVVGLNSGSSYSVIVTDVRGCSALASFYRLFSKLNTGVITNEANNSYYSTWGDYDADGDLDLFHSVLSTAGNNTIGDNFLFQNNCDGNFTKVSNIPGGMVTDGLTGSYSRWIDYDNDGDLDLYVGNGFLYENQGNGSFVKVTKVITTLPTYSPKIRDASFADFNNDGYLDAYFGRDLIYLNNHSGNFTVSSSQLPVSSGNRGDAIAWADYNNDGLMDFLLANSNANNYLFHNNGDGSFTSITNNSAITDAQNSYGCAWGDYDNDGDLDLWLNNNATGDRLFKNNGDGTFIQITNSGINTGTNVKQAGASWADYDNDGYLDLFVPSFNSDISLSKNYLFHNNGDGTFSNDSNEIVCSDLHVESYAGAWADYDNDGDLDLFVPTAYGDPNDFLYLNNLNPASSSTHNWIKLHCKGVTSNRDAVGARVYVKATIGGVSRWQMREINDNSSRCGENGATSSHVIHVGLGNASVIDSMKIVWPASQTTQVFTGVTLNRFIEITEGSSSIVALQQCKPDLPVKNPGYISGRVYNDINANCTYDAGIDFPIANRPVQALTGAYYAFTNDSGIYIFKVPAGNYTVNTNFYGDEWNLNSCQTDSAFNLTVIAFDTVKNINFSEIYKSLIIPCQPGTNLLTITPVGIDPNDCPTGLVHQHPCPGHEIEFCYTVTNTSNLPTATGTVVTVTLPSTYQISAAIPNPGGTNPITWGATGSSTINVTLTNAVTVNGTYSFCIKAFLNFGASVVSPILGLHTNLGAITNLITNPGFESGNIGFSSAYSNNCFVGQGNYCVTNLNAASFNPGIWACAPMTGSNYMWVDGASNSSNSFWCQSNIPASQNTVYNFRFGYNNLTVPSINRSDPQILATFNTVNLPVSVPPLYNFGETPDQWISFGGNWCSQLNTSVDICLYDNITTNIGNDFAIDNIIFEEAARAVTSLTQTLDCACDPNSKFVTPQGCGPNGNITKDQMLTYTIHFENTGSSNAHKIVIRDELDENVDINSFRLLNTSHSVSNIQIIPNSILIFEFDSIELAADSSGFITYSIKPNTGLADGIKLMNQAGIYFDSNYVDLTNVTLNTVYDYPEPDAKFSSAHNCTNSGLSYDFTYAGNTADNANFTWSFADGIPLKSTLQNPSNIVFSSVGYKIVTLTINRNGCEAIFIDSVFVTNVVNSGDSLYVCYGQETILIPLSSLSYYISIGACIGECINPNKTISSVIAPKIPFVVNVAPNPANDFCIINFKGNNEKSQNISLNLYNYSGTLMQSTVIKPVARDNNEFFNFDYTLNTSSIPVGLYLVKVNYLDSQTVTKLMVQ